MSPASAAIRLRAGNEPLPGIDAFADRLSSYLGPDQVNLVHRAYYYVEQTHDGQRRRSGEPYVTHPLAVSNILAGIHTDRQSLMAAMLHDAIEDIGIAKEALTAQFGRTVSELVDEVSKLTQMNFETKAKIQAENFQKMAMAMARDIRVTLVKLADHLHDTRALEVLSGEKHRRVAKETLEIYAPIANRLGMHTMRVEFEDLGFKAMRLMRVERIRQAVKKARGNRREIVDKIQESLVNCLAREGMESQVIGREKHLYSIYRKMRGEHKVFNEIMDVYTFRVIVDKVDTYYRILGAVHSLYKPFPRRFKDYIAIPKVNGYQSLHTTLFGMHGVPIETQIHTHEMEEMANYGIVAHWLYKSNNEMPKGIHARACQWVKGVLELQQRAGNSLELVENVKIDLFPGEIYVFTPKGRIMELPKGSTVVDFAHAVHTDVDNSYTACRVNRRLAPLSEPLQNGQTVEIVTAPDARPNSAWLSFVVTGKAHTHIRHALKLQRRSESINLGKRLSNKTLTGFDSHLEKIPQERIQAALAECRMEVFEDLLEEIDLGNRMAYMVVRRLLSSEGEEAPSTEGPLATRGTEGLALSHAKCCTPIPGDPIVGHLFAGKGVVVHLESYKNISEVRHNLEKYIQLNWTKDVTGEFNVELRVELKHQCDLITLLATSVNAADGNIEKISMDEYDGRISVVQLVVSVRDHVHLARVIRKLRALKGMIRITRLRS